MSKNNNIHDKSYKDLFSNKETFLSLIQTFVNNNWGNTLKKENLILVDKSYILSDYAELESDIVYKANFGDTEVFFFMLLEFQSSVDYRMPIRLLLYMIEIWREILKNTTEKEFKRKNFKLPSIVPIVLYNGHKKWTVARRLKDVISNSDIFGDNILDFKYEFLDINTYTKEALYSNKNISSAIFLLDQNIDVKEFYTRLSDIILNFNNLKSEEKLQLKHWLTNVNSKDNNYKNNIAKLFNSNKEEVIEMTSNISKGLEKFKKQAITEGKLQGQLEGRLEGKLEGAIEILIEQLTKKFKVIPEDYIKTIKTLPERSIKAIATDIFEIEKIEELQKYFPNL